MIRTALVFPLAASLALLAGRVSTRGEEAQNREDRLRLAELEAVRVAQKGIEKGMGMGGPSSAPAASFSQAEDDPLQADEQLLQKAGLGTDAAALVEFFRLRGRGPESGDQVPALIAKLGSKSSAERNRAARELIALGPPSIPYLRQAVKDPDAALAAAAAERCLKALESNPGSLSTAAARVLARRQPANAAEVLLDFLPHAEDEAAGEEIKTALASIAYPNDKPHPVLLKALTDASALHRAVAIEVLCQNGRTAPIDVLRKLLLDPVPTVRLRAALALAEARDPKAVSTLITLLTELPLTQARQAEDYLVGLASEQAPKAVLGNDDLSRQKCRDEWAKWWLATEGPGLVEELRKRTPAETDRETALALIKKLGDDEFETREKAEASLRKMGPFIIPLLRQAARGTDEDVKMRANRCLTLIEKDNPVQVSPVTARLLALRKPAGAAEAIITYFPLAEDEAMLAEMQAALNVVTYRNGVPEPAILKALEDRSPLRRGAAAEALASGPAGSLLSTIRKLLKDPDPGVRLKTALALAGAKERDAIPVLIASLTELPSAQTAPAEDYLRRLAGDAPPRDLPEGDNHRQKRRDEWAKWWAANGAKVALVDRHAPTAVEHFHHYTLLVQPNNAQIFEQGPDGKVRWLISGLSNPQDAQVLPGGNRVLIVEGGTRRVSERNLKGEILWQKVLPVWVLTAQRLPNGRTFIASNNLLMELDRNGNEAWKLERPGEYLMTARKHKDGTIGCITNTGFCLYLDASGKELKRFRLPSGVTTNYNDLLPGGGCIVPIQHQNKVTEYDSDGKTVWEANVPQPMSATRLPNGHTFVTSQQWPPKIIELDRTGKQVSEFTTPNYTVRARQR
jgi:HEAT repeat protein